MWSVSIHAGRRWLRIRVRGASGGMKRYGGRPEGRGLAQNPRPQSLRLAYLVSLPR